MTKLEWGLKFEQALWILIIDAKQMWMHLFIHLIYLLNTYCVSGTFLGLKNIAASKTSVLLGMTVSKRENIRQIHW